MASTHTTLDVAASERKARLAKLASLKRKQPPIDPNADITESSSLDQQAHSKTDVYLSRRNYDVETRGPKLGFENAPTTGVETLEEQAEMVSITVTEQAMKDESEAEKGLDLFKLQPKKPNWDLKRDLTEKMKILDVRTQNAIACLARDRIQDVKNEAKAKVTQTGASLDAEDEEVGIEGNVLVRRVHQREREEEEKWRQREFEEEEDIS